MLFRNKAEEAAEEILAAFQSPERLPRPLASVFIYRKDGAPCRKWSWRNQVIVALRGHAEARGFRQWEKVGRRVRKGERSFRILSPLLKTITDEKTGDDKKIVYGFCGTPVFGLDQTEGDPLAAGDVATAEWLKGLPVREVAETWGLSVEAYNGAGARALGKYRPGEAIALGVENLSTWAHELVHAADDRRGTMRGGKVRDEVVAELGGAVLLTLLGYEHDADLGGCWDYVRHYAGDKEKALAVCGEVLDRTCAAVALILDTAEEVGQERGLFLTA
jgi:hypothetical protein